MNATRASIAHRWRLILDQRWKKTLPPEQLEKEYREASDPYAAHRVLDRLLLPEFVRYGSRTLGELAASDVAQKFGISPIAVFSWTEAARRRGLVARCTDVVDVEDRPLPQSEWNITSAGMTAHQKARWRSHLASLGRTLRVAVPVAAAAFTLAKLFLGDDWFPDKGLLNDVQLSTIWDLGDLGPTLAGVAAGMLVGLIRVPFTVIGRKRYVVANVGRILEEQRASALSRAKQDEPPSVVAQ